MTLAEVESAFDAWNKAVEKMKSLSEKERLSFYLGRQNSMEIFDGSFSDTIKNLVWVVDDSLFFINGAIKTLAKAGNRTLPFWLKRKIAKVHIPDKQHAELLPKDDYKEGWHEIWK